MVDLLDLFHDAKLPMIWALRYADYWKISTSCTDVLRMLVLNALQINPDALLNDPNPISVTHIREAANVIDWVRILDQALRGVPRAFVILDADLLNHVTENDRRRGTELVEMLRSQLSSVVKISVSASTVQRSYVGQRKEMDECITLRMDSSDGRQKGPRRRAGRLLPRSAHLQ